jgi:hypothetical protein
MKNSTAILIQVVLLAVIGLMLWKSDCVHAQSFSFGPLATSVENCPTPMSNAVSLCGVNGTLYVSYGSGYQAIGGGQQAFPASFNCAQATYGPKHVPELTVSGCVY